MKKVPYDMKRSELKKRLSKMTRKEITEEWLIMANKLKALDKESDVILPPVDIELYTTREGDGAPPVDIKPYTTRVSVW